MQLTALQRFVADHCIGKGFDSCVPCRCYAGPLFRCQHPEHPKFAQRRHARLREQLKQTQTHEQKEESNADHTIR